MEDEEFDPEPLQLKEMDLEAMYFEQAYEAYRANDFKQCLVLLKHVHAAGPHVVRLSVDCTYGFWKYNIKELEDGPERQKNLEMVLASYSHMISISDPANIPPSEYIRISHIYLTEGSLQSAISILKLAQERGYLEDVTIVLQLWSTMKRLDGLETETENCMLFLMNAIFLEPRPKDFDQEEKEAMAISTKGPLTVAMSSSITSSGGGMSKGKPGSPPRKLSLMEMFADAVTNSRPNTPNWAPGARKSANLYKFIGSELNMSYAYCHVAAYCRMRTNDKKIYSNPNRLKKYTTALKALLAEAYYLATDLPPENEADIHSWFNNWSIWDKMGDALSLTPYILLAEESYWQSFLTDSTLEKSIEKMFNSMRLYRRDHVVWDKLMEAIQLAPFNIWLRNEVVKYEKIEARKYNPAFEEFEKMRVFKDQMIINKMTERGFSMEDIKHFLKTKKPPLKGHFETRFERDITILIVAQAHVRRFLMLKDFGVFKAKVLLRRERYRQTKHEVNRKYLLACNKVKRHFLGLWQKIAKYLKLFNFRASTIIQTHYRRHVCQKWLKWMRYKVQRANSMFPLAAQLTYDFGRMRALREWNRLYWHKVKSDAVDKIVNVIRTFGVSKKFFMTMDFILAALKIHRRYSNKQVWYIWKARYKMRQKLHAKMTIRWWIRRSKGSAEESAAIAAIEAIDYDAKVLEMKTYGKHIKRKMLKIWVSELRRKRMHVARVKVAIALYYIYHKNRVKTKIKLRRMRRERAEKFVITQKYLEKYRFFLPWKRHAFAQRIQRRARSFIAKKKLKRLKIIAKGCAEMIRKRNDKIYKVSLWKLKKYMYLEYRYRCRMANLIKKCFRNVKRRNYLRKVLGRRHRVGVMTKSLGLIVYRYAFRKFHMGSDRLFKLVKIAGLCRMATNYITLNGFKEFKKTFRQQKITIGLLNLLVYRRLNAKFWLGCHHSVSLLYDTPQKLPFNNVFKPVDVQSGLTFLYKETPVFSNKQLEFAENVNLHKAFKSWIAVFREKYRHRAGGAPALALRFFDKSVVRHVGLRRFSCVQIQRISRGYSARLRISIPLLYKARNTHERFAIVRLMKDKRLFGRINVWTLRRIKARITIQCFFRKCKARVITEAVKEKYRFYKKCADYVSKSIVFNKRLMKKVVASMSLFTCEKLVHASFVTGKIAQPKQVANQSRKSLYNKGLARSGVLPATGGGGFGGGGTSIGKVKARNRVMGAKRMAVSRDDSDGISIGSFVSQHSDIVSDKNTRDLIEGEFQSQEFYTNIDKIKKTGIFVIDIIKSQMTSVEMNYCVARASTLFIQGTHTAATSLLVNTFQGNKLVFCGGNLNHQDSSRLFQALLERAELKDLQILHLIEINASFAAAVMLSQFIMLSTGPPSASSALTSLFSPISYCTKIRDLYVDSRTFGTLGLACVLIAARLSSSLKSLSLKNADLVWPAAVAEALMYNPQGEKHEPTNKGLSEEVKVRRRPSSSAVSAGGALVLSPDYIIIPSSLEELRFFGCPVDDSILTALVKAVGAAGCFTSLVELEFTIESKNKRAVLLSERIIHIAKDRVFRGKKGISVRVNAI